MAQYYLIEKCNLPALPWLAALPWQLWKQAYDGTIGALLAQTRLKVDNPLSARVQLLGISLLVPFTGKPA